ncbi:MAG TPA: hypothetical protein VGQ35_15210 [Dongiaceae bacterium]|jgi:hypothetical protein|nr:hypothetical protein [Dongiaceae bacterium]
MRDREQLDTDTIHFIGEQDGESERLLKDRLVSILDFVGDVDEAYLARIELGTDSDESIALCLLSPIGDEKKTLDLVQVAFAELFNADEHLDILFLRSDQRETLRSVCRPFFVRRPRDGRPS